MATVVEALQLAFQAHQAGDVHKAEQICLRILEADPVQPDALHLAGVIAGQTGRKERALHFLTAAVARQPNNANFHFNLGVANLELDLLDEAASCYRQSLTLEPNSVKAYHNLANTFMVLCRYEEAIALSEEFLRGHPQCVEAHQNLGLCLLRLGNFAHGWPEYEWRLFSPQHTLPAFRQPRWDGSPLAGRTILLLAEQGYGDTLQFVRYASMVKERGGTVLVQCDVALVRLLAKCHGIDRVLIGNPVLPFFDVQSPLMSLPGIFGTSLTTMPAEIPYLFADPQRVEHWRSAMSGFEGFKIGIVWRGSPGHREDRQRSIQLAAFAPLAQIPGVRLFSLQKGNGREQLQEVAATWPVVDLTTGMEPDFMDTAAVVQNLDLVVSADTSVAHLAGGLGVPVWVPLPAHADWRWLLKREDSPWYPTMRLFRQRQGGNWEEVFGCIREALVNLLTVPGL